METKPTLLVVDNFYPDPDAVRRDALAARYRPDERFFKGYRSTDRTFYDTKAVFERLLGRPITQWESHSANGVFQWCPAGTHRVVHQDLQEYAAVVFLTPDAPPECGTSLYRCPRTNSMDASEFRGGFYDLTKFQKIDSVGNVYNRMVLWNAQVIHAASEYFGTGLENSRLFQVFFFDC